MRRSIAALHTVCVLTICGALIIALAGDSEARAQFGRNKVQYRTFDWKYFQTAHFDVYFYDSVGAYLARFTANSAEEMLAQIEENWQYTVTSRIPIIVYNSKNEFQQTNVIDEYLPEGVGGVTELFKNRVTVPFEGDWGRFRHVIRHELVHAAVNDRYYGGSIQSLISNSVRFVLPIWMNEGLAEYEARDGYDVETDMFIRDAVLGAYLPDLDRLYGYIAYRGGQAFFWYVEQTYGRDKIGELLNRCKATENLDLAFRGAFGKSVREFSDQWKYDMKKLYFPDIADRKRARDFALPLTNHDADESFFNTSPSLSPRGDRLAWISDRDDFRSVFVMDVANPTRARKVIEGEENVEFEELHLLTPAIAWNPDGTMIALAVKSGGRDAIYVIDVDEGGKQKIELPLDAIYSVDWSPDGRRLAFQGIQGSQSDIFVYDMVTAKLRNITDDIFSDADPAWGADSRTVYFVSDRQDHAPRQMYNDSVLIWNYDLNSHDLFSIDADSGYWNRRTWTGITTLSSPTPVDTGRLLYISDANGIGNIYVLHLETGISKPLTNAISGIEKLTATRDGAMAAFSAWNGDGQDIFLVRSPWGMQVEGDTLSATTFVVRRGNFAATAIAHPVEPVTVVTQLRPYGSVRIDPTDTPLQSSSDRAVGSSRAGELPRADSRLAGGDVDINDYRLKFSTDFVQATGAYTSFYGVQGLAQMLFSDMLGDHQIYLSANLLLDLKNSDFLASYSYLAERVDYSITAFQSSRILALYDSSKSSVLTRFRQYGMSALASSPFDRFRRLDASLGLVGAVREPIDAGSITVQRKIVASPGVTYVFDNSRAWAFNPVSGSRYFLTLLASPKLGSDGVGFYSVIGDIRNYVRLSRYGDYSIGMRLSGGASFGSNPQRFFVGGVENWLNYSIRQNELPITDAEDFIFATPGYPLRGFAYNQKGGSKYVLANVECRYPLFQSIASGPIPLLLQYVSGVVFIDAGTAWNDHLNLFARDGAGGVVTDDLLIGAGLGGRAYVLGFPVRMDVAWRYTIESWSGPVYYFSIGHDF